LGQILKKFGVICPYTYIKGAEDLFTTVKRSNYKTKYTFLQKLSILAGDVFLHITLLGLLIKSVMFIWLINSEKATGFKFGWAFYGNAHILVYMSFIAVFLSFAYLFKNRARMWFLIFMNIVFTILIIGDLWYYRGFNSFLTLHVLDQTSNLENLYSDILSMMRSIDLIFLLDILITVPIIILYKNISQYKRRIPSLFFALFFIPIAFIYAAHYKIDILEKGQNSILFRICWTPNQTIANLSPIGYHIYDSYNYWLDNKPYHLTEKDNEEINAWFEEKKENLSDNKYKGLLEGKNLIILQIESLENFVIGQKIDGQEITPNLNKLLGNSLYFSNYHEQVYNGTSSDADLLTNTSVYPVRRGSTFFRYPNNSYNSLPKLLEKKGYSTVGIHPDKGSYWNWMPALNSIGFQKTIDSTHFNMDETIGLGLSDGSYLRQITPLIIEQKQPFYSFLVTLTSHGPFDIPKEYRELKLDKVLDETKMGGYLQSIHYVDKHLGILIDNLHKEGILDNSVLAVYGDHTGIHKYYEDEVSKISPQQDWWKDNNWRIPLIIYEKNLVGEEIKTVGGQIDLLPTLSYLIGVDKEEYETTAMGRNLLNSNKNFAVLSSGKYIGDKTSETEEQHAIKGLELADKIIRSNYFKNHK
jgi:phosphoglycerol transferase MdoB-like AlkP superfamily enzyme